MNETQFNKSRYQCATTSRRVPREVADLTDEALARLATSLECLTSGDIPLLALRDERFRALERAADDLYPDAMNEAIKRLLVRGHVVRYGGRQIVAFEDDAFRVIDEHGHTRYAPQHMAFRDEHYDIGLDGDVDGRGAHALAAALLQELDVETEREA